MSTTTPIAWIARSCSPLTRKAYRTAMLLLILGVLGFGALSIAHADLQPSTAEKPPPRLDRFGDPLPPGAIRRFGTLRFRHNGIEDLAFTPDGKHLIAAGRGKPLVVFDADTGRKLRELGKDDPQYRDLRGFAISPDGKRVARCGPNVVFVWELQTGRLIRQLYWAQGKEAVFSPDGTKVAALKKTYKGRGELQTSVVVLEAAAEKPPPKIVAEKTIKEGKQLTFAFRGIAFSPDGKYPAGEYSELYKEKPFVYGASLSQVWLLDASTAARVRTFGSTDVSVIGFAFQPGSGRLATYGKDGAIRFWDVATGKEAQRIHAAKEGEEKTFSELRFSADGRRCAVLTDGAKFLTVLDTKDGRVIRRIAGVESELRIAIALSADGKSVASASPYDECCVRVWDVASGSEHLADAGHRAAATSLSLSTDGRTLTSRDEKGRRIQWDTQTGKGEIRPAGRRDEIGQFIWSRGFGEKILRGPRWRMVFKSLEPAIIEIRGLDGAKLIRKWVLPGTMLPIVALSPDGAQLTLATQGGRSTVMLWNPEREEQPRPLPGHPDSCRELLFSHDGKRLIGAGGLNAGNTRTAGT